VVGSSVGGDEFYCLDLWIDNDGIDCFLIVDLDENMVVQDREFSVERVVLSVGHIEAVIGQGIAFDGDFEFEFSLAFERLLERKSLFDAVRVVDIPFYWTTFSVVVDAIIRRC